MTRNEQMLENIMASLLVQTEGVEPSIMVQKIREGWKNRLKALYPQTTLKLGRKCEDIYQDYLLVNPPRTWNPQVFGGDLPKYLRELGQHRKADRYLPELADFEWSIHWVQIVPIGVFGSPHFVLNPFVRYLKNSFGIFEWWKTKANLPEPKVELVIICKDRSGGLEIFEPSIVEAAIIDALSEMALNVEQLAASVLSTLTGAQRLQVDVALNSLLEKGVVYGPNVQTNS